MQGDHSIFIQYGRPALAISSDWFIQNIETQDVTHTPKDNIEIVDSTKLVDIADAIKTLILNL
jgi:aminopeptidase YwaD